MAAQKKMAMILGQYQGGHNDPPLHKQGKIFWGINIILTIILSGCTNPFAPTLGDTGASQVPDASTIGGMLELFKYAYNTKDSLFYSQVLDSSFVFEYYDDENSRYDQWYRTTDLKATAGLFNYYEVINLNWYNIDSTIYNFVDSLSQQEFLANFNLTLDNSILYGFARFKCYKNPGSTFKITSWKDDF